MTNKPIRLSQANLGSISRIMPVPAYNRAAVRQSIVHIGVGSFHRAHQGYYLDRLLHDSPASEWGICGVGLLERDAPMRDALLPQDCLFTVMELGPKSRQAHVVGSLLRYLYAPGNPEPVLEKMASAECRIVTLTITEGGYYLNHGTGEFDFEHADIRTELAQPREPKCSFGFLAEALERRRRRGLPPFTVLSCDNLQHNGDIARRMFLSFADRSNPELAKWVEQNCTFPNSMVDRITPATTDEHRSILSDSFGVIDAWPVVTEPFHQWVVEDSFVNGRPSWERVGVQMTSDVTPYEKMKIRLLNGSHQALCYAGLLLGHETVHQAMADDDVRKYIWNLMDREVSPLIPEMEGIDLQEYKSCVIQRFANPSIKDPLARIAMESSARMPKFILPSILEQLSRGAPVPLLSFAVACWFRFLAGRDDRGNALALIDPMAEKLRRKALEGGAEPGPLLSVEELFGNALPNSAVFRAELGSALRTLCEKGARAALQILVSQAVPGI
jgi:mannitol 2-dehydrogenase